ncbi:MAG: 3-hydroxyacyl-ACP dehydratase FabZ [Gammaproteobacteria bacterium]|nr:3-hydroxyacyl-ACP dehydratase FabZ [Gammaproteobacteria bacterium]
MNLKEVMIRLPHRYPFLLIDKVLECDSETYIVAQKNITYNEPYFQGHFPEYAVLPGVLVLEAMAQSTGILAFEVFGGVPSPDAVFMLAGIDNAKFRRQVVPGDVLIIRAESERRSRNMMKFLVTAKVNDELVCSANIMGAFASGK